MPWRVFPGMAQADGQLHRPLAYGYGSVGILGGFALWAAFRAPVVGVWDAALFLLALMVSAGLGTMAPRVLKRVLEHRALQDDVEDLEAAR